MPGSPGNCSDEAVSRKGGRLLEALRDAVNAKSVKRSSTVLLLKNLPASANENDLKQMFMKSGELVRFIMPPTKTMALVEFAEAKDAKRALRSLAYKGITNPLFRDGPRRNNVFARR